MNFRNYILATALVAAAGPLLAQNEVQEKVEYSTDKYKVETNGFWNNWYISAGGGVNMLFSDHDRQMNFGDRLSPNLDVSVGKWFTPSYGFRLAYNGLSLKGATQNGSHSTGEVYDASKWLDVQKFNFFNLHADGMVNVTNLFWGYNEKRVWNLSPYVGLGVIRVWEKPDQTELSANFGLYNTFRLCEALDLNLDLRGVIFNDRLDGETGGRGGEGMLSLSVGLTYKFPGRGWDRSKTITRFERGDIERLQGQLRDMNAENERLQEALEDANDRPAGEVKHMVAGNLITFRIGKSELSNQARANLGMMAEVIKKADPKVVYTITGYADAGTGSKELNEQLSKERAEAVYRCLVEEFGVSESQLRLEYKGGVENMYYDDPRLSRAVITEAE